MVLFSPECRAALDSVAIGNAEQANASIEKRMGVVGVPCVLVLCPLTAAGLAIHNALPDYLTCERFLDDLLTSTAIKQD